MASQTFPCVLTLSLMLLLLHNPLSSQADISNGTTDGTEEWGFTDVRPGAHMFWWLYYSEVISTNNLPLILWLQGGPGASGVGFGNFEEIGPLTTDLKPRSTTWLSVANLLFVDNPVGTGFSYVDDSALLSKNNKEATVDLVTFLEKFFGQHLSLQNIPFFIVAESYGGKFATELSVALQEKKVAGSLNFNFEGIALGDTWISPIDFLYAWPPLLKASSLIDEAGVKTLQRFADAALYELQKGNYTNATHTWGSMEDAVLSLTDNVDFYNFLKHDSSSSSSASAHGLLSRMAKRHLRVTQAPNLTQVMNGPVRQKLGIIPANVSWAEEAENVFVALGADFMKDTIYQVDELLAAGVDITIYSGQLDLICCTTGTEAWVQKLKWSELQEFNSANRTALYCNKGGETAAFMKKHKNLTFFWIMNAGHMVPSDNPCMALKMLKMITGQSAPLSRPFPAK